MSQLKRHHWFWMVSVFFLILTIFYRFNGEHTPADFNSSDAYFVIPYSAATKVFTVLYLIIGFLYWLFFYFKISLNRGLTEVHTNISIGIAIVYLVGKYSIESSLKPNSNLFKDSPDLNLFIIVMVLLVLATQLILILNIILSLMKNFQSKN